MSGYWHEAVTDVLVEAGVACTSDQLLEVVASIEVWAQNESMASGRDCISNPLESELYRVKQLHQESFERAERQHNQEVADLTWTIKALRNRIAELERLAS